MSGTLAITLAPVASFPDDDSAEQLSLTEAERAMLETIRQFGDAGWEIVAAKYPLTWRTFHTVPMPRTAFHALCEKRLVRTEGGRILLTEDGNWIAGMLR